MNKQLSPDEIMNICDQYSIAYTSRRSLLLGWLFNEKYSLDNYRNCISEKTIPNEDMVRNWSDHKFGIVLKKLIPVWYEATDESMRFFSLLFFGINSSIELAKSIILNDNEALELKIIKNQTIVGSTLTLPWESLTQLDVLYIENEFKKLLLEKNDADLVKYLIYQAFLISFLDNYENLNIFYGHVMDYSKLFNEQFENENKSFDKELRNFIIKIYNEYSLFPHDNINPITHHIYIPFYSREEDKFGNEKFPNCVAHTLYCLCNMLLWDPEKKRYRDQPYSCRVKKIFSGNKLKKNPDHIESNEWSRIIQDIENSELIDLNTTVIEPFNSSYSKLYYKMSNTNGFKNPVKNELKSGLFNMLNFFIEITGIDKSIKENYKTVFDSQDPSVVDKSKLSNLFKKIFETFLPKGSIDSDKIQYDKLRFIKNINRYDIFGTFLFPIKLKSVNLEFELILYIYDFHTEMHMINYKNNNNVATIDEISLYFDMFKDSENERELVCHFIKSFVHINFLRTQTRRLQRFKESENFIKIFGWNGVIKVF